MALILVVDDQPLNRQFLSTLLGYCGHRTVEASDGAGALAACRIERPDLVIADILMPTMDGYEFVRMLRQDSALAQTPVVFWSAIYHEREARALAESCGVHHLITKPAEPESVLEVVAAALQQPSPPVTLPMNEFARDHSRLLANKLAATVEEVTAANSRLAALLDIGQQLAAERDPDRLVRSFCPAARDLVGCRYAGILLLSDGRPTVPAVAGLEADAAENVGPCVGGLAVLREALEDRRAARASDVRPFSDALAAYLVNGSLLAAPLRSSNGPLGVAFFLDKVGAPEFAEEDERLAVTLAAQVGIALENAMNYAGIQRHAAELEREVEERKEAEAALRASEQKFAKIFYSNPRPMFIASALNGCVIEVNDSLVRATGFGAEELIGKAEAALPLWDEAAAETLGRTLDSGALPRDLECSFRTRGCELRTGLTSAETIDLNGLPCRLWILNDITEWKQAEQALRHSREDLNRAQAVAQTGSWRLNVRRNELLWSDETYRIFGIPLGTPLTYETFLGAVHPEDRTIVHHSWEAALAGAPYDLEHRIIVGETVKWVRERAKLELDAHGALAGGFGTVQDITERKQAEERIRQQNAVLGGLNRIFREALTCETEEQLGRVCLMVAEAVTHSRFGFIAALGATGRLDAIAISDPGWEACRIGSSGERKPPVGFEIRGIYGRVIQDGKGFFTNEPKSEPDCIGLPEGHPPVEAFLGVPLTSDGKAIGMIALANRERGYRQSDLEALEALAAGIVQVLMRKRAERALRAGEERLRQAQKMESIGLLAGGIAHDFNNLLTSIMGNASLLGDDIPESGRAQLAAVILATERAADLTRQLLAYAGKGRFVVERLNFSRVVREMVDLLRASIPRKVDVKLALPAGLPGVEADPGQLQQIVMNLVINAAEAIGENQTGTVFVTTRAQEVRETEKIADAIAGGLLAPGTYVCFEVQDTGCGMDGETRAKIFDPFFTTKFMGRGLGLAAVAGIVQSHGGAIQLETAPGQGSRFSVFLPAAGEPGAHAAQRPPAFRGGTGTVLLVDDDTAVRDFARGALERYGYQVLEAKNGRQAVRLFEKNGGRIGLVLLDLMMPVMGGDDAIGALKQKRPDLPVIVFSGYSESEALRIFAGKGVSAFLQKPFTAVRLAEEVARVLSPAEGVG